MENVGEDGSDGHSHNFGSGEGLAVSGEGYTVGEEKEAGEEGRVDLSLVEGDQVSGGLGSFSFVEGEAHGIFSFGV